jgi:hypothetical protein
MTLEERVIYLERTVAHLQMMNATPSAENDDFIGHSKSLIQSRGNCCIRVEQAMQRARSIKYELQTLKEDFSEVAEYLARDNP